MRSKEESSTTKPITVRITAYLSITLKVISFNSSIKRHILTVWINTKQNKKARPKHLLSTRNIPYW
jgi:hypothetical protein